MMNIKTCLFAVLLFCSSAYNGVCAQEKTKVFDKPKFSGYAIGQYQYNGQHGAESNTFSVRMVRLSLDGRILGDFAYKLQGQINGNTSTLGDSPRLVDVYLEWQKLPFLKIKALFVCLVLLYYMQIMYTLLMLQIICLIHLL